MCSHVHVAGSGISTYDLPARELVLNQWASTLFMELSMNMVRKLVTKKELKSVYGVPYSPAHIARLEKDKKFPVRVNLGQCRVAWFADEIEAWIASRPRAA